MKKNVLTAVLLTAVLFNSTNGQNNVGIGTASPHPSASLDITSNNKGLLIPRMTEAERTAIVSPAKGLMVYQTDSEEGMYTYDAVMGWVKTLNSGDQLWKKGAGVNELIAKDNNYNVGIGISTPGSKLSVGGNLYNSGYFYNYAGMCIGCTEGEYFGTKFRMKDGYIGLYSSYDDYTWTMGYDPSYDRFFINNGAGSSAFTSRLVIENGGQVGIGVSSPAYNLDIAGNLHTTSTIYTDGSIQGGGSLYMSGNAYVDDNKGLVRAATAAQGNIKILKSNYSVTAVLGPHAQSGEFSIVWQSGIFATAPTVFACNETSTGGTVGQLYMVLVKVYGCTTTSCKARLINTSAGSVNYSINFDVMMIGN